MSRDPAPFARNHGICSSTRPVDRRGNSVLASRRWHFAVGLLLASWATFAAQVAAEDWDVYRGWTVSGFDITGIDDDTAAKLKRGLALARTKGLLGGERALFLSEELEEDMARTKLFLARQGYPYSRVTMRTLPEAKRRRIGLTLQVDPGPPVIATLVSLDSLPPTLPEGDARRAVFAPGKVLADTDVESGVTQLHALLLDRGHAHASVVPKLEWLDSTRVHVHFVARPGPVCYFGDLILKEIRPDLESLARKTAGIHRGEIYSPAALADARVNLRTLNLFLQTRLETADAAPDTVDVLATLIERRSTTIEASVRYWTDESIQGMSRWTNRNLFQGGRGLTAGISASTFTQKADVATWWPAIAGPNTMLVPTLRAEREDEESYTTLSVGGILSLRYNLSFQTQLLAGVDVSQVDVTEKVAGDLIQAQDGLLTALRFEASRRRTDDPITATHGTILNAGLEWAPEELGTDNSYALLGISAALFTPILPRTQVACRVLVGGATPTGGSQDLLPNKRFYSGGAASHRGFHRRKLGPLDEGDAPIGGEAKLETSVELRFPLVWRLRGAAFVDAGQAWRTSDDVRSDNVEVAVGPGLWLTTPIGPIRADLGYRLTFHETSQPRWVFHFTAGPSF